MNVQKFDPDEVIETLIGPMRVGAMSKRLGGYETKRELCSWREFWYNGQLVRRDVSVQLKTVKAESRIGVFARRTRDRLRSIFSRTGAPQ